MITGGLPRSVAWFVAIAPLVALPWWGEHFPRALRTMNVEHAFPLRAAFIGLRSSPLCFLLSGRHSVRPKARTFSQLVNSTSCAGSVGPPVIHMMKRIMALSYHG